MRRVMQEFVTGAVHPCELHFIVCQHKNMSGSWEQTQDESKAMDTTSGAGIQATFHSSKDGARPRCPTGFQWDIEEQMCLSPAQIKEKGDCPWGTRRVVGKDGKVACAPVSLPYGQPCVVIDKQRPTWLDPASKIQIADVPRWAGGLLADKEFINAVKLQGAMEFAQALTLPGGTPHAALTKDVGLAHSVVSHLGPEGQQGLQQFGITAFKGSVPGTIAAQTRPTAATVFARSGF